MLKVISILNIRVETVNLFHEKRESLSIWFAYVVFSGFLGTPYAWVERIFENWLFAIMKSKIVQFLAVLSVAAENRKLSKLLLVRSQ